MNHDVQSYGPVLITKGVHKGRIGYYDDDEGLESIVYFGSMFLSNGYYLIPANSIRQANTTDLLVRNEELYKQIGIGSTKEFSLAKNYDLLLEKNYIDSVLSSNYLEVRFGRGDGFRGVKVFISHSSADKGFVRRLATDLKQLKIEPWVDEWKIRAGESIPQKLTEGIDQSDCVVVVLSKSATASKWVEREWQTKYWDEIERNRVLVIPVLLEDCKLPPLLKTKKYADFRGDYNDDLTEVILAIPPHDAEDC